MYTSMIFILYGKFKLCDVEKYVYIMPLLLYSRSSIRAYGPFNVKNSFDFFFNSFGKLYNAPQWRNTKPGQLIYKWIE